MKSNICSLILLVIFSLNVNAQITLTTSPPLTGGNGQQCVSFNVQAHTALTITEIGTVALGTGPFTNFEIWYSTTPITAAPTASVANGWILAGSTTTFNATAANPTILPIPIPLSIVIPAGQTYGFVIGDRKSVV